jgi:hypothetical protein
MAPLEVQKRVCELVTAVDGGEVGSSPSWLNRPTKSDCGRRWPAVKRIYTALTGQHLPSEMPPRERRSVDLVLIGDRMAPRIVEVDEVQHFNAYRATTSGSIRVRLRLRSTARRGSLRARPSGASRAEDSHVPVRHCFLARTAVTSNGHFVTRWQISFPPLTDGCLRCV